MSDSRAELRAELEKSAATLRTLRDELRVQLHLGKLEAKDEWRRLEPRLESALERAGSEVSEASRAVVKELTDAAEKLRDSTR